MIPHGWRLIACLLGIHAWTRALGTATFAQACRHCGWPRTR